MSTWEREWIRVRDKGKGGKISQQKNPWGPRRPPKPGVAPATSPNGWLTIDSSRGPPETRVLGVLSPDREPSAGDAGAKVGAAPARPALAMPALGQDVNKRLFNQHPNQGFRSGTHSEWRSSHNGLTSRKASHKACAWRPRGKFLCSFWLPAGPMMTFPR